MVTTKNGVSIFFILFYSFILCISALRDFLYPVNMAWSLAHPALYTSESLLFVSFFKSYT